MADPYDVIEGRCNEVDRLRAALERIIQVYAGCGMYEGRERGAEIARIAGEALAGYDPTPSSENRAANQGQPDDG